MAACVAETHPTVVRRVGVRDVFGESGTAAELFTLYCLRAADIIRDALEVVALKEVA